MVGDVLQHAARLVGVPVVRDAVIPGSPRHDADTDLHSRLWLRERTGARYPQIEVFYVPRRPRRWTRRPPGSAPRGPPRPITR